MGSLPCPRSTGVLSWLALAGVGVAAAVAASLFFGDTSCSDALPSLNGGSGRPVAPVAADPVDPPAPPETPATPQVEPARPKVLPPPDLPVLATDLSPEDLKDDGPLPFRRERLLDAAEIDEMLELVALDLESAETESERQALQQRREDLIEIRALNEAVDRAWFEAKAGRLDRATAALAERRAATRDVSVRAFLDQQEQEILRHYGEGYRR